MLYDAVSLDNRYSTFRHNQVVSYWKVNNIKNVSFHEDVCASLSRRVDNKLPGDTMSHLIRILNAGDRIQDGTGFHEAGMTQEELKKKILKDYL